MVWVVVALLVWTLGAVVYSWQLWTARGLTDHGYLGLILLVVGSIAMFIAVGLVTVPFLGAVCMTPGLIASAVLAEKLKNAQRLKSLRARHAELRQQGPLHGFTDAQVDAMARAHRTAAPIPTVSANAPTAADIALEEIIAKAEIQRGKGPARMFE